MMNDIPRFNVLGQMVIPPHMVVIHNEEDSQERESLELVRERSHRRERTIQTLDKFNLMLDLLEDRLVG